MSVCVTLDVVDLGRAERRYIDWPITGQSADAVASVEVEGDGAWHPGAIGNGYVTGYFAGPDFVSPSPATVVAATSHVRIRIVDGPVTTINDGGFIRLR
jgi:hypothetical protein